MMKEKLLIVDDNGDLRKMLRIALGYGMYQMFEAEDAVSALRIAEQEQPDVILLDVMMPGEMDGFKACEVIKSTPKLKDAFVIMLTALDGAADRQEGARVKADYYMTKPFSPLLLIDAIEARHRNGGGMATGVTS